MALRKASQGSVFLSVFSSGSETRRGRGRTTKRQMHEKIKGFYIAEPLISSKELRWKSSGGPRVQISQSVECLPNMYRVQHHINLSQRKREMGSEGEKGKERRSHPLKNRSPAALVPRVVERALASALLGS